MANRKAAYGKDKGKVLKKGEYSKPNGNYAFNYIDSDGSCSYIYAKTLKRLREREKEIEEKLKNGIVVKKSDIRVCDIYDTYLKTRNVKASTMFRLERNRVKYAQHPIYNMRVDKVKASTVLEFASWMSESLAPSTARKMVSTMASAFKLAVQDDYILKNPFDCDWTSQIPKATKSTTKAMTDKDFDRLIAYMKGHQYFEFYVPHIIFLRETGLRISEFCALTVSDVDFGTRTLNIDKQVEMLNTQETLTIGKPKTDSSIAKIPLTPTAIQALKDILVECPRPFTFDGIDGFFIVSRMNRNKLTSYKFWEYTFRTIRKAYNRDNPDEESILFTPHTLRHTFVTRSIRNGMSPNLVSLLARHANVKTTLDIYTHLTMDDARKELEEIYG